jgi:lipooligosaccharide transport system permease protein
VEVGGIFVEPFIFLIAIGFGLGLYIQNIDGASYSRFLAPGVIAGYAMFHASFDSTYGAYLRMEAHHIYEAILFTPLGPEDIVVGEVMWAATRGLLSGTVVLLVGVIFGLVDSPLAILAIPAAFLIGLMFASIAMLMTATATTIGAMNNFFTLFILPMFYVSGVFFPLDQWPQAVQIASWALPLTPSVSLVRGLVTGDPSWLMGLWLLEILAYNLVALTIASVLMRRRLAK